MAFFFIVYTQPAPSGNHEICHEQAVIFATVMDELGLLAAVRCKIPALGICWNEKHRTALLKRLRERVFKDMGDSNSELYDPAVAKLMKVKGESDNKKPKKSKVSRPSSKGKSKPKRKTKKDKTDKKDKKEKKTKKRPRDEEEGEEDEEDEEEEEDQDEDEDDEDQDLSED